MKTVVKQGFINGVFKTWEELVVEETAAVKEQRLKENLKTEENTYENLKKCIERFQRMKQFNIDSLRRMQLELQTLNQRKEDFESNPPSKYTLYFLRLISALSAALLVTSLIAVVFLPITFIMVPVIFFAITSALILSSLRVSDKIKNFAGTIEAIERQIESKSVEIQTQQNILDEYEQDRSLYRDLDKQALEVAKAKAELSKHQSKTKNTPLTGALVVDSSDNFFTQQLQSDENLGSISESDANSNQTP